MTIPDSINTVSSLLTLIDYALRFAKYISPSLRKVLNEAQKNLSQAETPQKELLTKELFTFSSRKHLPKSELETASLDLQYIVEAIHASLSHSSVTLRADSLPWYGTILGNLLNHLANKIDNLGCFERWGTYFGYTPDVDTNFRGVKLLPANSCTSMLRKTLNVGKSVRLNLYSSKVYFVKDGIKPRDELVVTNLKLLTNPQNNYEKYLEKVFLSFPLLSEVSIVDVPGKFINGMFQPNLNQTPISATDFELLYSGLLNDLVQYAHLVRAENKQVHSFIDKIRQIGKK